MVNQIQHIFTTKRIIGIGLQIRSEKLSFRQLLRSISILECIVLEIKQQYDIKGSNAKVRTSLKNIQILIRVQQDKRKQNLRSEN